MESFKSYLIEEYKCKANGFVAVEFKFTHHNNVKVDKKTKVLLHNDIIKVSLTFVDKSMNKLFNTTISFENNVLPKSISKKLVNIAPKELENRFNAAKKEIISSIMNELCEKLSDINSKINALRKYYGDNGIIPTEFKGESINIHENTNTIKFHPIKIDDNNERFNKQCFDM